MNEKDIAAAKNSTRALATLVPLIQEELAAATAASLEHYRRVGELLIMAKEQVPRGDWESWLKRNFQMSPTTARRYMKLFTESQKNRPRVFKTLSEVSEPNRDSHHGPTWQAHVRQSVADLNVDRWKVEAQKREAEQRLLRQLSNELIDIGYKVLATQLHPDKGGSTEAMKRLNVVRAKLKEVF